MIRKGSIDFRAIDVEHTVLRAQGGTTVRASALEAVAFAAMGEATVVFIHNDHRYCITPTGLIDWVMEQEE